MAATTVTARPTPAPSLPQAVTPTSPHPILAAAASAVMLWLAFDPVGWWWFAWFALVPWFLSAFDDQRSVRSRLVGSWVGGYLFWLLAVEWIRVSDPSAFPAWFVMAGLESLGWPLFLGLALGLRKRWNLSWLVAVPVAWLAVDWLRGNFPFNGFSWYFVAHSQYRVPLLIQVSDLAGAWGLTLLIVLFNVALAQLWALGRSGSPIPSRTVRPLIGVLALVPVVVVGYGAWRLSTASFRPGPVVALLQSDVPQVFNRSKDHQQVEDAFRRLIASAQASQPAPDVLLWPEASYPFGWVEVDPDITAAEFERQARSIDRESRSSDWLERRSILTQHLCEWVDSVGKPMVVGATVWHFGREQLGRYNAMLLFEPGKGMTQRYDKIHLVPFGEYVPLVDAIPWFLALTPFDEHNIPRMTPGTSYRGLVLGPWRMAGAICFEDSVPWVVRRLVKPRDGEPTADLLLNLSNDGWFRSTAAHETHLANSVMRAVELRVPVARSVNTGISALIDGNGAILTELPESTERASTVSVPLDDRQSGYLLFGDWLPLACLAVAVAGPLIPRSLRRLPDRPRFSA